MGRSGCSCRNLRHPARLVVLTGGPGAGKTAVLEVVRRSFCRHVLVLPESAGILFGGGFPRHATPSGHRAVQRGVFHVQRQLERLAIEEAEAGLILCDRGTLDGYAYWPPPREDYWSEVGTTHSAELARYSAVIHLRTPTSPDAYGRDNPLRIESLEEAAVIDARIAEYWGKHPHQYVVPSTTDFLTKAARALAILREQVPECCRHHVKPFLWDHIHE